MEIGDKLYYIEDDNYYAWNIVIRSTEITNITTRSYVIFNHTNVNKKTLKGTTDNRGISVQYFKTEQELKEKIWVRKNIHKILEEMKYSKYYNQYIVLKGILADLEQEGRKVKLNYEF